MSKRVRRFLDSVLSRFRQRHSPCHPNQWLLQIFRAKTAQQGGIVRRSKSDVEKYSSLPALISEVERRGYHLWECGGQYVILCDDNGDFRFYR